MILPTLDMVVFTNRAVKFAGKESWLLSKKRNQPIPKNVHYCYCGQCTGVIRRSYDAVGLNMSSWGRLSNPNDYRRILKSPIGQQYFKQISPKECIDNPCPGDILLYDGTHRNGSKTYHGAVYTLFTDITHKDGAWISDAIQAGPSCYGNRWYNIEAFRYRGPISCNGQIFTPGDGGEESVLDNLDFSEIVPSLDKIAGALNTPECKAFHKKLLR